MALHEPFGAVDSRPVGDGVAEVGGGVVELGPEALLLQGADEPFDATACFRLPDRCGVVVLNPSGFAGDSDVAPV
jgi:hypothetical protein